VATLGLGIEIGIGLAVVTSLVVVFARIMRPHTAELGRVPGTTVYRNVERFPETEVLPGVAILRLDVSLNFANVSFFKRRLRALATAHPEPLRAIVLDFSGVNDLDVSAEQALGELVEEQEDAGVELHLCNVKGPVRDVLVRGGLWRRLGAAVHASTHDAVQALDVAEGARPETVREHRLVGIDERG
jgi:sulfate permease, SulP family